MKTYQLRVRDPCIFAEDGKYYLYGSKASNKNQHDFKVYTSTDLENWSDGKVIFERTEDFWAKEEFWAAEMHKYNGKYYLFVSFMSQCSQILVCDTPDEYWNEMLDKYKNAGIDKIVVELQAQIDEYLAGNAQ